MRRFLILMMLACLCNCTFAQSVVTGIVRDTIGTALEGVIVRVNADKATLGFARTSENGTYKITLKVRCQAANCHCRNHRIRENQKRNQECLTRVQLQSKGKDHRPKRGCCKSSSHLPTRGYFVIQLSLVYRKE